MIYLLAQNVPPAVSGHWLWGFVGVTAGLGGVLFCWNQFMKALDRFSGKSKLPQPMQYQEVALNVTKPEFQAHIAECKADRALLWTELSKDRHDSQVHASERSKTLYIKIEAVRTELTEAHSELRTEMQRNFQDTERALGRIEGTLEELRNK